MYENGQKISIGHPCLLPEGVILDSALLDSLPDYHRKSCALDALSQGIESYWSRAATEESRVHAYLAILGVLDNLKAYLAGDAHAADEMLEAAYQSGRAIQITRTTAAHAMSYQLTKTGGPGSRARVPADAAGAVGPDVRGGGDAPRDGGAGSPHAAGESADGIPAAAGLLTDLS